jgi:glyoxylase-like metal-dependent hydrolase (beta-lactamase superfamily II)
VEHYRLEPVADGVLAAIVVPGGGGVGNAAIVELGGSTLVFDTGLTPQAGRELREAAERIGPVSTVVNSHWHGDHVRGNQAFRGAEIVGTARTRELMETRGAERLAQQRAIDRDAYLASLPEGPDRESARQLAATIAEVELTPPTRTFDDRLELAPGVEVATFGGGHSDSDSFLVLADRGVLLSGDLVFAHIHPWMGDGDPQHWLEILERLENLGVDKVVPGHGEVSPGSVLGDLREHIQAFLDEPDGLSERFPDWDVDPEMVERNRTALAERGG